MRSRIGWLLGVIAVAGCKREIVEIPEGTPVLVVHGILNVTEPTRQLVLIERSMTGTTSRPRSLDGVAIEPIMADGGVPERDAAVQITAPDGAIHVGHEVTKCFGRPANLCPGTGAGAYEFFIPGSALVRGGTYRLHVVTTQGEVLTAETTVPEGTAVITTTATTFNRSTDTMVFDWSGQPEVPAYQVRVANPNLSWLAFTDSARIAITGVMRNPQDPRLGRVFLPGFRHLMSVSAVDANIYDYYRTSNSSFTGVGAISRISGGVGVFGSMVTIARRNVNVVANFERPIEGRWEARPSELGFVYWVPAMDVYVESPAQRSNQADAITMGSYGSAAATVPNGIGIGTFKDGKLTLAFTSNTGTDTTELLIAQLRGDSLIGKYRKGAPAIFVRVGR